MNSLRTKDLVMAFESDEYRTELNELNSYAANIK